MITHVLTTRFNVRFAHSPSSSAHALSLPWLEERIALFEKYCLPSVLYQTVKPDVWLIWLDEHSPPQLWEKAKQWQAQAGFIRPVAIGAFDVPVAVDSVREHADLSAGWLLTSRLDNDDAIHPHFFEAIRRHAVEGRREFLNVPRGLIIAGGKCFRKSISANPFIAFSEPSSDPKTVWAEQHGLLASVAPVRQVPLRDGWIQIVHGGNLSNTVRGVRVPASWLDRGCMPPALAGELTTGGLLEFCRDNTVGLWQRCLPSVMNLLRRGHPRA
jgi:hypothetical protein